MKNKSKNKEKKTQKLFSKVCKTCLKDKPFSEYRKSVTHKDGLRSDCRECMRKREAELREKNREHNNVVASAGRERRRENFEKGLVIIPDEKVCSMCGNKKTKDMFPIKKDSTDGLASNCTECKNKAGSRSYFKNKDKRKVKSKEYAEAHKELYQEIKNRYYQKNKDLVKERSRLWSEEKRKNDLDFRLRMAFRTRQRNALHGIRRAADAMALIGCSPAIANWFLEQQFYPHPETGEEMTWNNYGYVSGKHGWDYEHIIPLSLFDMTDPRQQFQAFHITNVQPMWYKQNYIKRNKNIDGVTVKDLRKPLFYWGRLKNG